MKKYFALLLTLIFLGCSSGSEKPDPQPTDEGKDRSVMLKSIAERIVVPSYGMFKSRFDRMVEKSKGIHSQAGRPDTDRIPRSMGNWLTLPGNV